jgi:SAM-dependent methyltransferase
MLSAADTEVIHHACPVCVGVNTEPFLSIYDNQERLIVQRDACLACGHVFHSRMPAKAWFENFYSTNFETSGEAPIHVKKINYSHISDVIENLYPLVDKKNLKILDVGCGYGSALSYLETKGYRSLFGIEPSQRRADLARTTGFLIHHGFIEDLPDFDGGQNTFGEFDFVYSHHAYEHTVDLQSAVANLANRLKVGGYVCICVPNFLSEHLVQQIHYLPHVHAFTENSLSTLFRLQGFEVVSVSTSLELVARKLSPNFSDSPLKERDPLLLTSKDIQCILGEKIRTDLPFVFKENVSRVPVLLEYSDYAWHKNHVIPSKAFHWKFINSVPMTHRLIALVSSFPKSVQKLGKLIYVMINRRRPAPFLHCEVTASETLGQESLISEVRFTHDFDVANTWSK